jgi:hypothetical protein
LGGLGQLESLDLSANGIASFDGPNIFRETFRMGAANLEILNLEGKGKSLELIFKFIQGNPIDCSPEKIEWLWTLQRRIRVKGKLEKREFYFNFTVKVATILQI